MLFLCHEKVAKYVTKESKYVIFLTLKTLKLALLGHFYCQNFCQSVENETHFLKKLGTKKVKARNFLAC